MTDPLITIGMPVYNGAAYVAGAIQSLLDQTERDFLLLISDDRSDDETPSICQRFADRDNRIRFVQQPVHLGMTRNFNFVFDEAASPFFVWAAQDDLWAPGFLEETIDLLTRDPAAIAATTAVEFINPIDGRRILHLISDRMADEDPMIRARSADPIGHAIYALFRRAPLVSAGVRLEEIPAPDVAFVWGLALRGRIVSSGSALSTRRSIGYEAILSPGGRVVWKKALGPDGRLYAWGWARTDLCRTMLRHTGAAPISLAAKTRLTGHILRLWLSFMHQQLLVQTSRPPVVHAWERGRYLRSCLLALGGALLRPRRLTEEFRTIARALSRS